MDTLSASIIVFIIIAIVNLIFAVRMIVTTRRQRMISMVLGFFESALFIYSLGTVTTDFSNLIILFSYCLGAAVGGYIGMIIEERLMEGYVRFTIITLLDGHVLALKMRADGFGVTEIRSIGRTGDGIHELFTITLRRNSQPLIQRVRSYDPKAFVTIEEITSIQRGWLPIVRHLRY